MGSSPKRRVKSVWIFFCCLVMRQTINEKRKYEIAISKFVFTESLHHSFFHFRSKELETEKRRFLFPFACPYEGSWTPAETKIHFLRSTKNGLRGRCLVYKQGITIAPTVVVEIAVADLPMRLHSTGIPLSVLPLHWSRIHWWRR